MLSERINNALNAQINKEFYSAYLYLSIANYFSKMSFLGFAHWCKTQAAEEINRGMDIFNFLTSLNGKIELMQISTPDNTFVSPLETSKQILLHEKQITENLRNVAIMAKEENSFSVQHFLEKMLFQQTKDEEFAYEIYNKLKLFGESKSAMYLLDDKLTKL